MFLNLLNHFILTGERYFNLGQGMTIVEQSEQMLNDRGHLNKKCTTIRKGKLLCLGKGHVTME